MHILNTEHSNCYVEWKIPWTRAIHAHIYMFAAMDIHFFLGTPSLSRKSSSIRGRPSRNLILGSHPSNSFAFVMSGFLCRGSSGVFSTVFISTLGLISCQCKLLGNRYKPLSRILKSAWLYVYSTWRTNIAKRNSPPSLSPQVQALWIHLSMWKK